MAVNLSIQSPDFERIKTEAGYFTRDAIMLLWLGLNDTRATETRDVAGLRAELRPAVLSLAPTAAQNNLDIRGYSVLSFTGSTSVNLTGMTAPDTDVCKLVIMQNSGTGTITIKNLSSSSESQNQFSSSAGTDVSLAAGAAKVWAYLAGKWRQIV